MVTLNENIPRQVVKENFEVPFFFLLRVIVIASFV